MKRGFKGFTILELLLASSVIAVLIGGLSVHLRGGIEVWRRSREVIDGQQYLQTAFERIRRDISSAIVYDAQSDPQVMHEFGSNEMFLFSVVPEQEWREVSKMGVRAIRLWCGFENEVNGLWRSEQTVGEFRFNRPVEANLLLPDCQGLRIQYASLAQGFPDVDWLDNWERSDVLPRIIRIDMDREKSEPVSLMFANPSGTFKAVP